MTNPTGSSYDAKFDGKDYPYKGDPGTTSVVLKKIDANTFEEIDKRDGKVISTFRMTLMPDGKTMKIISNNKLTGTTDTFNAVKESTIQQEGSGHGRALSATWLPPPVKAFVSTGLVRW